MSFDIGRFVLREPGPDVDVSPDVWSALVAYHTGIDYPGKPSLVGDDGAVRFYGLHGLLCVRELESLPAGTIRSMGTREAVPVARAVQTCSYCGAPGQAIGTRCEYCQVAVSQ